MSTASADSQFHFPTVAQLHTRIATAVARLGSAAQVERLGVSGEGRPIDMISVGDGPRSAMIVGVPHPNEPVGCVTVAMLLEKLADDPLFRAGSGFRWHCIPAIDIDGLALNEGWFAAPRTPENYLHAMFRPALALQPEYSFPMETDGYCFDRPTAENLCWQKGLAIAKPDLLCSLHAADVGGVFYIASRALDGLAEGLAATLDAFGLPLNLVGEPFSELPAFGPGLFGFPPIAEIVKAGAAAGGPLWEAGTSSAEYAEARYGTFSLTCEVPLWDSPQLRDDSPSAYDRASVVRQSTSELEAIVALLERAVPLFRAEDVRDAEGRALLAAIEEALTQALRQREHFAAVGQAEMGPPLPTSIHASLAGTARLAGLRPVANVGRLARLIGMSGIAEEANRLLGERLAAIQGELGFTPVPTAAMAGIQLAAIEVAARRIAGLRD